MNALALTECVRPNPGDMSTLAPTSEKYYSPPLMIHHPRLYEVPEHPVPAVLAQSRRETIPIHDDTVRVRRSPPIMEQRLFGPMSLK